MGPWLALYDFFTLGQAKLFMSFSGYFLYIQVVVCLNLSRPLLCCACASSIENGTFGLEFN